MHALDRDWPETNCYVDLWIEVLASLGHEPEAAFGFTVTQDFEGDQFTFFKPRQNDLATLFDVSVQELTIYGSMEQHLVTQLHLGRLVLVEVDSFYLPDTKGVSYRTRHAKTTIAVNEIDIGARRLSYFHNARYCSLSAADYDGLFRKLPDQLNLPDVLPPYVEFIRTGKAPLSGAELAKRALALLTGYLAEVPLTNPVKAFGKALERDSAEIIAQPIQYYHDYAFNTVRQLGANFEVLGSHLDWLVRNGEVRLAEPASSARKISASSKAMLFQLARMASRKRVQDFGSQIDALAGLYDETITGLHIALSTGSAARSSG
jgi:Domain of unknown function (DUF1839)